jgi:protein-S-isoprenylcysteine O-methyltransferase Ste14
MEVLLCQGQKDLKRHWREWEPSEGRAIGSANRQVVTVFSRMTTSDLLDSLCWGLSVLSLILYWATMRTGFEAPRGPTLRMRLLTLISSAHAVVLLWCMSTEESATWQHVLCAAVLVSGLALFVWTRCTLGAHRLGLAFSEHESERLLTQGPWRAVRHPHYTSYMLTWCGMTIGSGELLTLVGTVSIAAFYVVAARQEEQALSTGPLAPVYRQYADRTGMFLPRVRL